MSEGLAKLSNILGTAELSSSVLGSSDGYAQLLTAGNFEIISNMEKNLVRMRL